MKNHLTFLRVKLIIFFVSLFTTSLVFLSVPKTVFLPTVPYQIASSTSIIEDDNLLLYNYKVYSNEDRFELGLQNDVILEKEKFSERSELMLVKIPGNPSVTFYDDYVLVTSLDVPELNIEYYLVKNIRISDYTVPARTFIMLLSDVIQTINTVYALFLTIVFFILTIPQLLTLTGSFIRLYGTPKVGP